jgi:hypothetical protein
MKIDTTKPAGDVADEKLIVYILEVVRVRFPFEALKKKVMELKRKV